MQRSVNAIRGYALQARDGAIGRCEDFLFDDEKWVIRYMVAETGRWLHDRTVLISPLSLGEASWGRHRLKVGLTRKQIEESPLLDSDAPVSRQHERRLHAHHAWPAYWIGDGIWGTSPPPLAFEPPEEEFAEDDGDPHLRSIAEVSGYAVEALDGEIGPIADFIMDESTWQICFAVVRTGKWLPSPKVLIAPGWVASLSWQEHKLHLNMTKDEIRSSPRFNPGEPVNHEYEEKLYDYYGRPRPRMWTP